MGGCPDRQNLGLVRVELQAVLQVPLPDVSSTRGKNGKPIGGVIGVHRQVQLCVVGILVVLDPMLRDDIGHWTAVHGEQQWAEYRALRNADVQLCCVRLMLAHLDKLSVDAAGYTSLVGTTTDLLDRCATSSLDCLITS